MPNRIKEILKNKGITQIWLAKQLGKSTNAINQMCQNTTQPSLKTLYKIADILNIEIKDLL